MPWPSRKTAPPPAPITPLPSPLPPTQTGAGSGRATADPQSTSCQQPQAVSFGTGSTGETALCFAQRRECHRLPLQTFPHCLSGRDGTRWPRHAETELPALVPRAEADANAKQDACQGPSPEPACGGRARDTVLLRLSQHLQRLAPGARPAFGPPPGQTGSLHPPHLHRLPSRSFSQGQNETSSHAGR